jgi:hypothetical protein
MQDDTRPRSARGDWPRHGATRELGEPIDSARTTTPQVPGSTRQQLVQDIGTIPFSQQSAQASQDQPTVSPGQLSQCSKTNSNRAAYLGESGYMSMFRNEPAEDDAVSRGSATETRPSTLSPVLLESYLDTYFDFCYTWCPILDRATMDSCAEFSESSLLREAVALLGSHLNPPLIPHLKPRQHYVQAKRLFYENQESQPVIRICAVMLFYWWSSGPPNVASIDTNWWWMGASIRLAQEIGLHREQDGNQALQPGETHGLRRRLWWTLFVSISVRTSSMEIEG